MFFKQIKHYGDNFSYVIADENTKEAAVVDSSYNTEEITKVMRSNKLALLYIISTHGHSDHTAGNVKLQALFGAKTVSYCSSKVKSYVYVHDGDILHVGEIVIKVIYTPGHSEDSISLLVDGKAADRGYIVCG